MQEAQHFTGRFLAGLMALYVSQRDVLFLWVPVLVGIGVCLYFAMPTEPPLWGALLVGACLSAGFFFPRIRRSVLCLWLICLGFIAADIRTELVYTPVIKKEIKFADIEGRVLALEALEDERPVRGLIAVERIEDLAPDATPRKVRLKMRADEALQVGQRIRLLAGLTPPSRPMLPGGFDFERHAFYKGIGAYGFAYRPAEILDSSDAQGGAGTLRRDISLKIANGLDAHIGAIALALMTGERAAIADEDAQAIRDSGLAHMLAISGLHISLVFGTVFFFMRAFLAMFPYVALHYPIKKWAALAGMGAAIFYMFISGASIPTQRAVLMLGLVFVALLLDRTPFSKRLVAFAALIVLLIFPESLTGASFQMSFAAAAALVAFYEEVRPWMHRLHMQAGWAQRAGIFLLTISMTTIVATFATAPITLYNFQQIALYSLLANILAIPVLTFIVMPFALISFALMPFGLEEYGLMVVGYGVGLILDIAHWVAGFDGAVLRVAQWPISVLLSFSAGFILIIIMSGRARLAGLVPIFLSVVLALSVKTPDILVSESGKLAVVRAGQQYLANTLRAEKFERESWQQSLGLPQDFKPWPDEGGMSGFFCDALACRYEAEGAKLSFLKNELALKDECAWADIVIAPRAHEDCDTGARVIDRLDLYYRGAHALYLDDKEGVQIVRVEDTLNKRPWRAKYQ